MAITLQFMGAARQVTGSRHLLTVGSKRILLECGMVQGPRTVSNKANTELGIAAGSLDAVVLSHAHIDHSGSLPRLVKLGYGGPIHCTRPTADLSAVLLRDSAHLQEQDARYLRRKDIHWEPPADGGDVDDTVKLFRGHEYHTPFEVVPGVTVEFLDAGHIFGSAMEVVTIEHEGRKVRLGFTGDHGRRGSKILRDPERLPEVDVLISESTYGDREHASDPDIEDELAQIVNQEMQDGGRILVPAFAVGRTQGLLMTLSKLIKDRRIPAQPVWADSPLAAEATKITRRYPQYWDQETRELLERGADPFFFEGARTVSTPEESMSLNDVRQGIIIASSGMCEGGRILHHLKRSVTRKEDCVLAVGYMAQGTLGRKLIDGYEYVPIHGQRYPVRCKVRFLPGLSAHADWKELVKSLRHLAPTVRQAFIVHGEEAPALRFADHLRDVGFGDVHVPVRGQKFEL